MRLFGLGLIASASIFATTPILAQTPASGPIDVPAKTIQVPSTVSPQLQKIIAMPLRDRTSVV